MIIRTDNDPGFTGKAWDQWAHRRGLRLGFIRPGKPTGNGHIESSMAGFGKSA